MHAQSLISPRVTSTRSALSYVPFFLLLPLLVIGASSTAAACPFDIEVSAGTFVPSEGFSNDKIGPQGTLGLRVLLPRELIGGLMIDGALSRHDHQEGLQTPEFIGASGGTLRLLQATIVVGTNSRRSPNIAIGVGRIYMWRTDVTIYEMGRPPTTYRPNSERGTVFQAELNIDIIHSRAGDIFGSARLVRQIDDAEYDRFTYMPFTVGFRFH